MFKMKKTILFTLISVLSIFGGEDVFAIGCQYTGEFDKDIVYSRLDPTAQGNEYKITLYVNGDSVYVDEFLVRSEVSQELLENNLAGIDLDSTYANEGWSNWEDMGKKNKEKVLQDTNKAKIVEEIKNGNCPPLYMYFGKIDHNIKLFLKQEECDEARGWLMGKCPRANFTNTEEEEIYEKEELNSCSDPFIIANFENEVANKVKKEIENAAVDASEKIQKIDPNWSDIAIFEEIFSITAEFETEGKNRIAQIDEIATEYTSKYLCFFDTIKAENEKELNTLLDDKTAELEGKIDLFYDEAEALCDDYDCIENLRNAKDYNMAELEKTHEELVAEVKRTYEKIAGANFEKIGSNTCEEILGDVKELILDAFDVIKIAAPILLIFFGTMDFAKAVIGGDDKTTKKATSDFMKRTAAAVAIFFLPFFIELLFSLPGINELAIDDILCGISKVVLKK